MGKSIKYIVLVIVVGIICYNSVYFKKLSDIKAANAAFDPHTYAQNFLFKTLPANKDKAIAITQLATDLPSDPKKAYAYSHAQNSGDHRFFMVHGEGTVQKIEDSDILVNVAGVSQPVALASKYIIGTAARDGSGLISADDFVTTTDMNNVSEELNKLIRTRVLPPLKAKIKPGDQVDFTGCIEADRDKAIPQQLEVVPLNVKIK